MFLTWFRPPPAGALVVLSINAVGSLNLARNFCSNAAISPRSVSWSWPARCKRPCKRRTLSSVSSECPSAFEFVRAISFEIAMSPASFAFPFWAAGNDRTSVGLSLPRNSRFRRRIFAFEVTRTFTSPDMPSARWAARRNRCSRDVVLWELLPGWSGSFIGDSIGGAAGLASAVASAPTHPAATAAGTDYCSSTGGTTEGSSSGPAGVLDGNNDNCCSRRCLWSS